MMIAHGTGVIRQSNLDIAVTGRAKHPAGMTFDTVLSKMGTGMKHFTDRYAEYGAPMQDDHLFYTYEATQPQSHEASSKYTYGGGHRSNAAMSALTLLAFLFFLHILQQCIKDHMNAMATPQITIMAAGREGEDALKKSDAKLDKSGLTAKEVENKKQTVKAENKMDDEKHLMKINTADPPKNGGQNFKSLRNYNRRAQSEFVSAMDYN